MISRHGRKPNSGNRRDDPAWLTFGPDQYVVLAVARTLTSAYRLLEAVHWFRDDFRVRLVFTVDESSAFSTGVRELLRESGADLVAWSRIEDRSFDYHLALTASENIDFSALRAHTILLPHGLGFNKYVPNGKALRLAGLPPHSAIRAGKVTISLSHREQREQLAAIGPDIAPATEVVGDPTLDRLRASRPLRALYREAFGTGDRTLIVIASTWGEHSAIARWRTLPVRLLSDLDADAYQVLLVLHPNIWSRYGRLQIEVWLSAALAAGLILMPPESGWHAALIAADQVITDHGSLGLFAAALDKPLLMAGGTAETVTGTPVAALTEAAEELRPGDDLVRQLDDARKRHVPGQFDDITDRVFDRVGEATRNIQRLIYRRLGITAPAHTSSLTRIPVPHCVLRTVTGYVVRTAPIDDATLTLQRIPASVWHRRADPDRYETHVTASETEPDPKILERAAAVTSSRTLDYPAAQVWAHATLSHHPGTRLAVTATSAGFRAVARGGAVIEADAQVDSAQVQLIASAMYCWLLASSPRHEDITIRAGTTSITVSFKIFR
ncbi:MULTISPECIES: hypothetical protein [unclassified Nocardia]|uniref:hypothetical protein n=1 Tax=unclassified Nocardia TaxID=2637762 RepID=UPI001CE446D9|nr:MULTISPECIES: hypothetical protein [unclassified Nocardia]